MAEPKITKRKITDYMPDPMNANRGTERGQYMIDYSVQEVGAGRSIVASADDVIPIGNHALQAFADAGLEDVIEVETDGKTVVVVKRSDWPSADDPIARKAALLDNRASEVGLQWDTAVLAQLQEENAELLEGLFHDWELDKLLGEVGENPDYDEAWQGMPEFEQEDIEGAGAIATIKVYFNTEEAIKHFAELIDQPVSKDTQRLWYPRRVYEHPKEYIAHDES